MEIIVSAENKMEDCGTECSYDSNCYDCGCDSNCCDD